MPTPLDESAKRVLDLMAASGRAPFDSLSAQEARRVYREGRSAVSPEPPAVAQVINTTAATPDGAVPVRVYRDEGTDAIAAPALIFYHGGGWVFGDLDTHDVVCRSIARTARVVVVSVDYRLAPEHRYPAAVEDAHAVLQWALAHARDLGIDPARLAVGGDSAGGNLAAVVALMARDTGVALAGQMLFYPVTDLSREHPSYEEITDVPLTSRTMRWFRHHYLGDGDASDAVASDAAASGVDASDWRVSPLRADDMTDLPPAYVMTAGYDPLRDEGDAYAERLQQAGVSVTHRRYPGQIHGFVTMGRLIPEAGQLLEDASLWLQQVLSAPARLQARIG